MKSEGGSRFIERILTVRVTLGAMHFPLARWRVVRH